MEYFETSMQYTKHLERECFKRLPSQAKDFIMRLMRWEPSKRISAKGIKATMKRGTTPSLDVRAKASPETEPNKKN